MPRLGSRTQAPRQITRFGANVVPMCGQGAVRRADDGEWAYPAGMRLGRVQIGHYGPAPFRILAPQFTGSFTLTGTTRDSAGSPLADCAVDLFKTDAFDTWLGQTTSDGSGNFSFTIAQNSGTFWLRAYKPGSPDVAGTTVNTLTAA